MALELPVETRLDLLRLQPPPAPGLRLPAADQLHLTLHYLGAADPEPTSAALKAVERRAFPLRLEGVGSFTSPTGAVTLWAGVRATPELLGLHRDVAAAFSGLGFRPEARPYAPHVTLGRYEAGAPEDVVADFTRRHAGYARTSEPVERLGLYSSRPDGGVPVYRLERAFPLLPALGREE